MFLRRRFISIKQIYNKVIYTTYYIQKARNKDKKYKLERLEEDKKMGVATVSCIQSRDIIRSICSAYILFMQSTR